MNGMLLWMIPTLMYLGLAFLVLGMMNLTLSKIFGLFLWPILHFFVAVVEAFSRLPWAEARIEWFGFEAGLVYYILLFGLILRLNKKRKN